MRLPIIPSDPNSPGTIFPDFIHNKMSPGQTRIHCKPASGVQLATFAAKGSTGLYSPHQPLGKNSIREYFLALGRKVGIDNLCGHSLRALSITKMMNEDVRRILDRGPIIYPCKISTETFVVS
jgi:hypothetical protein